MLQYFQEAKLRVLTKAYTKELIPGFPNYVLKLLISSSHADTGMFAQGRNVCLVLFSQKHVAYI